MTYTLEEIKNFTPIERNEFIDLIIFNVLENKCGICQFIEDETDYYKTLNYLTDYFTFLEIPILGNRLNYWFTNNNDRISFLKSIKTAEQ